MSRVSAYKLWEKSKKKSLISIFLAVIMFVIISVQVIVFLLIFPKNQHQDFILYGVWKSETPEITLYIDPEISYNDFPGTYIRDGKEVGISIQISGPSIPPSNNVSIRIVEYDTNSLENNLNLEILKYGRVDIKNNKNDQMIIIIKDEYVEEFGTNKLVFNRIENYNEN